MAADAPDEQRRDRPGRRARLIDELRVAVPEEVRAAKRINSEGERIIGMPGRTDGSSPCAQDRRRSSSTTRADTAAEAESRRIIGESQDEAEEVRRGADEYAVSVLVGLEGEVVKTPELRRHLPLDERRPKSRRHHRRRRRADGGAGWPQPKNSTMTPRGRLAAGAAIPRRARFGDRSPGTSLGCSTTRPGPRATTSRRRHDRSRCDLRLADPIEGPSDSPGRTAACSSSPT